MFLLFISNNVIGIKNAILKTSTHLQNIQIATRGEVKQVKILGTVAMIDEGETDWKLFCIDVNDPLAKEMNGKDESYFISTNYALCYHLKSKLQVC